MSDAAKDRREELFAWQVATYEEELGPPDQGEQPGSNRRGESRASRSTRNRNQSAMGRSNATCS